MYVQTKKINMGLIVFTIFISIAILVLTFTTYIKSEPMAVYTVYLDGKSIGTIASKDSFDEFVNSKEEITTTLVFSNFSIRRV